MCRLRNRSPLGRRISSAAPRLRSLTLIRTNSAIPAPPRVSGAGIGIFCTSFINSVRACHSAGPGRGRWPPRAPDEISGSWRRQFFAELRMRALARGVLRCLSRRPFPSSLRLLLGRSECSVSSRAICALARRRLPQIHALLRARALGPRDESGATPALEAFSTLGRGCGERVPAILRAQWSGCAYLLRLLPSRGRLVPLILLGCARLLH